MDKISKIWLSLIVLTTISYIIGTFQLLHKEAVIVLLLITLIKGQLIIDYFMGLKEVSLGYRLIPIVWLILVLLLILLAYFL